MGAADEKCKHSSQGVVETRLWGARTQAAELSLWAGARRRWEAGAGGGGPPGREEMSTQQHGERGRASDGERHKLEKPGPILDSLCSGGSVFSSVLQEIGGSQVSGVTGPGACGDKKLQPLLSLLLTPPPGSPPCRPQHDSGDRPHREYPTAPASTGSHTEAECVHSRAGRAQ